MDWLELPWIVLLVDASEYLGDEIRLVGFVLKRQKCQWLGCQPSQRNTCWFRLFVTVE